MDASLKQRIEVRTRHGLFRRLGILLLVLLSASGYLAYRELLALRLSPLATRQELLMVDVVSRLNREVGQVARQTRLFKQNPELQRALSLRRFLDTRQLQQQFAYFAELSPLIAQLRWLDDDGREQARVNVRDGRMEWVPRERLQDKVERYYVREGLRQPADRVYLSAIDLNVENGRVVEPRQPTLRTAIRTAAGEGLREGLLVINFDLSPVFDAFRRLDDPEMHVELIDSRGYWLLHPDPGREWGFMTGQTGRRLAGEHPALWRRIEALPRALGLVLDGELWSFDHLTLGEADGDQSARTLIVLAATGGRRAAVIRGETGLVVALSALLLLGLGLGYAWRLSQSHDRVRQLARELTAEKAELGRAYVDLATSHERTQRLQDELVETRKLSSLGMMVAGVAHELNTPAGAALTSLTTVEQLQERLRRQVAAGLTRSEFERLLEDSQEGLTLAETNLRRVIELVRSFKRLAIDRSEESVQRFDLATCVQDLLRSLEPHLKRLPVRVSTALPEGLELESYPGILSQVLQNLIDNALNHGIGPGRDGRIDIRATLADGGDELVLCVADNGAGIDPAIRERIFDPFATTGRGQGHSGLGMHLVHQWVTQMLGGRIEVDSAPGQGTQVTLVMPLLPAPAGAPSG